MLDTILNGIISGWGLSVCMAIVSMFLGNKVVKYKNLIKEFLEVGVKYRQITREGSPGGTSMTRSEKDEFVKEIIDVVQAGATLFSKKKIPIDKRV